MIIQELTSQIRNSKYVVKNEQLKSQKWTKSCYEQLSCIIANDLTDKLSQNELYGMGSSISYKTLKNLFEGNYTITPPLDPRSLNTLNKISKFLNYSDWHDFLDRNSSKLNNSEVNLTQEEILITFIKTSIFSAFRALKKLSLNDGTPIKEFFKENSPAYNKIAEIIYHNKKVGYTINNKFNPSNCEILNININSIENDKCIIMTKEYWLLCWWDSANIQYHSRMKKIINTKYILNKVKDSWIITNTISKDDLFESF
jgi:hypothetical protein